MHKATKSTQTTLIRQLKRKSLLRKIKQIVYNDKNNRVCKPNNSIIVTPQVGDQCFKKNDELNEGEHGGPTTKSKLRP